MKMHSQIEVFDTHTLFVGEGDFSYSANYILKMKGHKERVFASCLNPGSLTERQKMNIEIIKQNGGLVYIDVDATCLELHPKIKEMQFSNIIFNFPHISGKMNIKANRQLVERFFLSAVKILKNNGAVHVTLCRGQGGTEFEEVRRKWCDTWQIVSLAASASLILFKVKPFDAKEFEMYRCTGFRGLQKPFNTVGSLTHIFNLGKAVEIIMDGLYEESNSNIADIYLQDCRALHKFIYENLHLPSFRVLSILKDITVKVFQPCFQESIDDLLTCSNFSSLNHDSFLPMGGKYCEECINKLLDLFLKKKKSGHFTYLSCSLCCLKNIDLKEHPIHNLLSYFSDDAESLLTQLPIYLEHLTWVFTLKTEKESIHNKFYFHNVEIISRLINDIQGFMSRKTSVCSVMDIYAKYSVYKGDEMFFHSDINFFLTDKVHDNNDEKETDKSIKIGTVLQYFNMFEKGTCIVFDLNNLACIKYHIMDYRAMTLEKSFYSSYKIYASLEEVYRSPSLYPPTYVHDTSFYIEEDFCENDFFMLVRNTVGFLIKSVSLVDSYYDENVKKQSRCYRFVYQSCDQALSKEKANVLHTVLMRKTLQKSLNICLR